MNDDLIIRKLIREMLGQSDEKRIKFPVELPQDVIDLNKIFTANNYELFVVGGAVRDMILKKAPKDWDLVTNAKPNEIISMLKDKYKILETGKAFGIVNVITPTDEYEIASYRQDMTKGRKPTVSLDADMYSDVKRRDLSINSLFYDINTQEIIDLVGGIDDIKNGIVRTVGNPDDRFEDDPLRKIRAIRFAARFGSKLDPATDESLKRNNSLVGVSPERIRDEFLKGIKSAKTVGYFLELLEEYDMFKYIFPSLHIAYFIEERDPIILISTLLKENEIANVKKSLSNAKYTGDEMAAILYLISFLGLNENNAYQFKKLQVNSKLSESQIKKFAEWNNLNMHLVDSFVQFKLSLRGNDLIQKGFKGMELGKEIERLEKEKFLNILQNH